METNDITFDFACTDDCLDKMVPSDLRKLVAERDKLKECLRKAIPALRMAYKGGHQLTEEDYGLWATACNMTNQP